MSQIEEQERNLQAKLKELDGPEWESDDDQSAAEAATKSTDDSDKKKRKKGRGKKTDGNVLYLGHLPPNFEEPEILEFVKQFGRVLNVRVARSKKTGGCKGYGFVEMQLPKVAAIVAETLSGYIMFGQKRLVCHIVPPEKVHPRLFFRRDRFVRKAPPQRLSLDKMEKITKRLVERERRKRKHLKELGIDYDFPGYEAGKEEGASGKKERKGSVTSIESAGSKGRSPKGRKRKESIESVDEPKEAKPKKRKNSIERSAEKKGKKEPSTPTRKSTRNKRSSRG